MAGNEAWVQRQLPLLQDRMTKTVPASTKETCCIHWKTIMFCRENHGGIFSIII